MKNVLIGLLVVLFGVVGNGGNVREVRIENVDRVEVLA